MTLADDILALVQRQPGLTDAQLRAKLGKQHQAINQACRALESQARIERRKGLGAIGNFPSGAGTTPPKSPQVLEVAELEQGSEDLVKRHLKAWLEADGWTVKVAWAKTRGVDIEATKNGARWLIEVKGIGSLQPMRVNYFIGMLGEMLQRMDDPNAKYSIALPDHPQYRGLWNRLPELAKKRTQITMLFVSAEGRVEHNLV